MKIKITFTGLLIVVLCLVLTVSAIGEELEISGFFDVVGNYQTSTDDKTSFGLGQAELDIAKKLSENISIMTAIAYNSDDGVFELGAAIIDIHLFGGEGERQNSMFCVKHSGIVVGQFDVPFGIDYNVYASIDRKLVSPPLVCGHTHEGWNDFGIQFNINWQYFNYVAYAVNGIKSSYEVNETNQILTPSLSIGDEVITTPANTFGTRIGLTPILDLEVGGSVAIGLNQSNESEMLMFGGDLQLAFADFSFKGEYIQHFHNRTIEEETSKGYYFQALYNINQIFLTGRFGAFQQDDADWIDRYTFGAGYQIANAVELRLETTINKDSDNNTNTLQLVGGF